MFPCVRLVWELWWARLRRWSSPTCNPLWAATIRVEARRFFPLRLAIGLGLGVGVGFEVGLLCDDTYGREVEEPVLLAQIWIAFAWLLGTLVAQFRHASLLYGLWIKERLIPILLCPMTPEEIAAFSGAPGTLLGLFVVALSLPAWAFGLGEGFFAPRDFFGYGLLVASSCGGFASWSSGAWETRLDARPSTFSSASTNKNSAARKKSPPLSPDACLAGAVKVVGLALFLTIPQAAIGSLLAWVAMWPREITSLAPNMATWPLLLARLLVYPLPFFGVSLPLWIVVVPFQAASWLSWHLALSAMLEARDGAYARRAPRIAALWRPFRLIWAPLMAGLLLPVAYKSGWLAAWRTSTLLLPSRAGLEAEVTLAWWHGVVAMGTFAFCLWLRQRASTGAGWAAFVPCLRRAARRVLGAVVAAGTLAPLACGHTPFPSSFPFIALQLGLVASVWTVAQLAIARDNCGTSREFRVWPRRIAPGWLVWVWLYGTPVGLALGALALSWGKVVISPFKWPFCLLSPATLWFAPRDESTISSPLFYSAAFVHLAFALILLWRASHLPEQAPEVPVGPPAPEKASEVGRPEPQKAALRTATRKPLLTPTPGQERLLGWFARFDNPLLRLEIRRALGASDWLSTSRALAIGGPLGVVVVSALGSVLFVGFCVLFRTVPPVVPAWMAMEGMIGGVFLYIALMMTLLSWTRLALYERDRLDGSLAALYLSPLRTRDIVAGKIAPALASAALYLPCLWPGLGSVALLLSLVGEWRAWPIALLVPPVALALCARNIAWIHLGSAAKSVSRGASWGAFAGFFAAPALFVGAVFLLVPDVFEPTHIAAKFAALALIVPVCALDCVLPLAWSVRVLERERRPR